jgi:hypothetical protein
MTWRSDVRDAFKVGLDAFLVANPTLVDHVYSARPASITDSRVVFIGGIAENINNPVGVVQRVAEVTLVCTRSLGENTETVDDLEEMADLLVDYLIDHPHLTSALTYQEPVRTTTTELPDGGTYLPAIAIVAQAVIQDGRT